MTSKACRAQRSPSGVTKTAPLTHLSQAI
jgi:hypothetical protein